MPFISKGKQWNALRSLLCVRNVDDTLPKYEPSPNYETFIHTKVSEPASYKGIANQGFTAWLNVVLQLIYHNHPLRDAIHAAADRIATSSSSTSAADRNHQQLIALSDLFHDLSDTVVPAYVPHTSSENRATGCFVSTVNLTDSWWPSTTTFNTPHDSSTALQMVQDVLKDASPEVLQPLIEHMFDIKETYWVQSPRWWCPAYRPNPCPGAVDWLEIDTRGLNSLWDGIKDYKSPKGFDEKVVIEKVPPVLRFRLDSKPLLPAVASKFTKKRFEYPDSLTKDQLLGKRFPSLTSTIYKLQSVVVYHGNGKCGHWYMYIRPGLQPVLKSTKFKNKGETITARTAQKDEDSKTDKTGSMPSRRSEITYPDNFGPWYMFDDATVRQIPTEMVYQNVFEQNFGEYRTPLDKRWNLISGHGQSDESYYNDGTSWMPHLAYLLVYVRV